MSDIISTVPWHCGDRDCPVGWHVGNYWIDADGEYTWDAYSDGDHDVVDESDVPGYKEEDAAWLAYWTDVLETGEDVLEQIHGRTVHEERVWQILVSKSIIGPVLSGVRRAHRDKTSASGFRSRGPWLISGDIPKHVGDYCLFTRSKTNINVYVPDEYCNTAEKHNGFERYEKLIRSVDGCTVQEHSRNSRGSLVFFVTVERTLHLPPTATKVRKVARKAIQQHRERIYV